MLIKISGAYPSINTPLRQCAQPRVREGPAANLNNGASLPCRKYPLSLGPKGSNASLLLISCGQGRRQLGFPLPDRLVAEHDAADSKHLGQVAQAQFVAQAPEHHEGDDIGGVLGPVQQGARALIELLTARAAAEPTIALGGALRSLRNGFRSAFQAPHLRPPSMRSGPITHPSLPQPGGNGASPDRTRPFA